MGCADHVRLNTPGLIVLISRSPASRKCGCRRKLYTGASCCCPTLDGKSYLELSARQSVKTRCNEFRSYSLRMPRKCTHLFSSYKCHDVHKPVRTPRSG